MSDNPPQAGHDLEPLIAWLDARGIWLHELSNKRGAWSCILARRAETGVVWYQVHLAPTAAAALQNAIAQVAA